MGEYAKYNAQNVLDEINKHIAELETVDGTDWDYKRFKRTALRRSGACGQWKWKSSYAFKINAVYSELSIFDWWNETLSLSQLKQMKKFVETAIKLGFNGYVCFKVGAAGCAHGMWAHKEESANGYSPDCDTLYHSFRSGDNYWDVELNGKWMRDIIPSAEYRCQFTLKEVKDVLKGVA